MLKYGQNQTLQLKLTPQQIQYLQLLQVPVILLEEKIKQELEQNPFLEEGLETSIDEMLDLELTDEQEIEQAVKEELSEKYEELTEQPLPKPEEEFTLEDFIKDQEDFSFIAPKQAYSEDDEVIWQPPAFESLPSRLLKQLAQIANEKELRIAEEILGNINEDGYLTRSTNEIAEDLKLSEGMEVTAEEVEKVLKKIQKLDPPGIGARDLKECLIAQLEADEDIPEDKKNLAIRILNEAYEDFMKKRYNKLIEKFNLSQQKLKDVIQIIQRLNPKPGEGETLSQGYIVPDFIVERVGDEFVVTLNDKSVPTIRLNRTYYNILKKQRNLDPELKEEIKKQFSKAKWFIAAIYQRRETLLKIMKAIVEFQREFFETGDGLKPMIYKDIAEKIKVDTSTISRAVNQKYVQTDFGIYKLKDLFSEKITTTNGTEVSNTEIKEKIKEIISSEDPNDPLTDDQIVEILRSQGYNIARRTVAKYRDQLGIPNARLRKRIE